MASSRQLMRWTPQVHEDILISMFHNVSLSPNDWARVMADLKEMGYSFTEGALRYVWPLVSALTQPCTCASILLPAGGSQNWQSCSPPQ